MNLLIFPQCFHALRDRPLDILWGGGVQKSQKKYPAKQKWHKNIFLQARKKNSCKAALDKKYPAQKNCTSPHQKSNGPSLRKTY